MKFRNLKLFTIIFVFGSIFSPSIIAQSTNVLTSKDKAALELYEMVGGDSTAEAGAEAMLTIQIQQNPKLAEYQDVFKSWFNIVLKSENFKNKIINIYSNHFTESELNELIKFYKTPLGQKTLKEFPAIMQEAAMAGQEEANNHSDELKTMLIEAMHQKHPELFKNSNNQIP